MKIQVTFNYTHKIIITANSKEEAKEKVRAESSNKITVWNDFTILTDTKAAQLQQTEEEELTDLFTNLLHNRITH